MPVKLTFPGPFKSEAYPIQFAFWFSNDTQLDVLKHFPEIVLGDLNAIDNGLVLNLQNKGLLDSNYEITYWVAN